jgi:hypothetical protein
MTELEQHAVAMNKLTTTVDLLERLKNLSMAEWLVAVMDVEPISATARPSNPRSMSVVGHA